MDSDKFLIALLVASFAFVFLMIAFIIVKFFEVLLSLLGPLFVFWIILTITLVVGGVITINKLLK